MRKTRVVVLAISSVLIIAVSSGTSLASCTQPTETVEYVIGKLTGVDVEPMFYAYPGDVVAVVEKETVKYWDAIPSHSAASATLVVGYWGDPPDIVFQPVIDGAEPTRSLTTISCDPSVARSLGERELGVVFEDAGYVRLVETDLSAEQARTLTETLGAVVYPVPVAMGANHPMAGTPGSRRFGWGWAGITAGATALVGWAGWLTVRRRHTEEHQ